MVTNLMRNITGIQENHWIKTLILETILRVTFLLVAPALAEWLYLLTMVVFACLFACGQIDILCKKLTPGGFVLALKVLPEVLKDTFYKKLAPGGCVLTLKIPKEVLKDTFCKKLTTGGSFLGLVAYSQCKGMGLGQVQGMGLGLMGPNALHRDVHTAPRQGQEPDPLSPIVPVSFPIPVLAMVPCSVNKP